ncbi:MAG: glycoside hydrolase family 88 protein [Ignavibacteria bacterium]|jgi:rhamnogalacturonyl hydrolase YesR
MKKNDSNTPLHLLQPDYDIPYVIPSEDTIAKQLLQVLEYLEQATPEGLVDKENNLKISSENEIDKNTKFADGDFRLTSYEWGVTYAGMLLAGDVTGDYRFSEYAGKRIKMIADLSLYYLENKIADVDSHSPVHSVLNPQALDDAGALCAAMIKAEKAGLEIGLRPLIDNFINYIYIKEYRFADGTLARNRPYPNTLWLDDLFMSIPALAQMAQQTGEKQFFDDAVKQVVQFSERMFNKEKGLYMHGWVQHMDYHPGFYWGRANGWAVMAMVELLSVLPESHPGYKIVLEQFRTHVNGLITYQAGTGFWHQLLDRNDTYLETSATAIITYSITKAINMGLIDKSAYAPISVLGWNAVSTKINKLGQVEGTCVGTGMGFDPAFYYYRPINVFAAHGYGPVLLAGAEIICLLENNNFEIVEGSIQLKN